MNLRCPHCRNPFEIVNDESSNEVTCPSCNSKVSINELLSINPALEMTITASQSRTLTAGERVAHFQIKHHLGTGGFGSVFSARDTRLERDVAIKIPRMDNLTGWQAESFIHEAQSAAQLNDPNIVTVHEIGRDEETVYIVSELIEGITLSKWNTEHKPTQKEMASMISKIARSIHNAHEKGVIHRDLKPSNVLVDSSGQPHITDFGLAKRETPEEITVTTEGQVIGTPAYMSPEQASGQSQEVDRRTDVYSLGVMLYELVAGKRPYRGESDLLKNEILEGNPDPIRTFNKTVSPDLEAICLKAMSLKPGDRFHTALEFSEDLDRFVDGEPTVTRPPTGLQNLGRWLYRHRVPVALLSLVILLAAVSYYAFVVLAEPSEFRKIVFETEPAENVSVAIVEYDPEAPAIRYEKVLTPSTRSNGVFEISLKPGWYLVEVVDESSGGIQEVIRYVPAKDELRKFDSYLHTSWTTVGKKIEWPRINVLTLNKSSASSGSLEAGSSTTKEQMVYVPGGPFRSGSESVQASHGYGPMMPLKDVSIAGYWISETEVTVERFEAVMGQVPKEMQDRFDGNPPRDYAITDITWDEAVAYCESIGARLPTFDEYCYAATNSGKTLYPWGEDASFLLEKSIREVRHPASDRMINSGVFGLFSGVDEWTLDPFLPIDGGTGRVDSWPQMMLDLNRGGRIVVGNWKYAPTDDNGSDIHRDIREFYLKPHFKNAPDIGFRCYRSDTPRLK